MSNNDLQNTTHNTKDTEEKKTVLSTRTPLRSAGKLPVGFVAVVFNGYYFLYNRLSVYQFIGDPKCFVLSSLPNVSHVCINIGYSYKAAKEVRMSRSWMLFNFF